MRIFPEISCRAMLLWGGMVLLPQSAAAHSPLPGLEGFYAGLVHPVSSLEQVLVILGLALLLGSFALARLKGSFAGVALGVVIGMVIGSLAPDILPHLVPGLLALALIAGVWAALAPGRGFRAVAALCVLAGAGLGLASVPEPGPQMDRVITMGGSCVGTLLAIFYGAGAVDLVREKVQAEWPAIAMRVLASWVAAASILMLAFVLSSNGVQA